MNIDRDISLSSDQQAVKHANDERDKYLQIYAQTHERFVSFERKQLQQMRRLLLMLSFEQYKALMGITLRSINCQIYLFVPLSLCVYRK